MSGEAFGPNISHVIRLSPSCFDRSWWGAPPYYDTSPWGSGLSGWSCEWAYPYPGGGHDFAHDAADGVPADQYGWGLDGRYYDGWKMHQYNDGLMHAFGEEVVHSIEVPSNPGPKNWPMDGGWAPWNGRGGSFLGVRHACNIDWGWLTGSYDMKLGYLLDPWSLVQGVYGTPGRTVRVTGRVHAHGWCYPQGPGDWYNDAHSQEIPWQAVLCSSPPTGGFEGVDGTVVASGTQLGDIEIGGCPPSAPNQYNEWGTFTFDTTIPADGVIWIGARIPGIDALLHAMGSPHAWMSYGQWGGYNPVDVILTSFTAVPIDDLTGDPVPLEPPCVIDGQFSEATVGFSPMGAADTVLTLASPLPPAVDKANGLLNDATPPILPYTVDLAQGTKFTPPVETVEVTAVAGNELTVVRGIGCKPAGDWPVGGDATIQNPYDSSAYVPVPGDANGLRWLPDGSTTASYIWAVQADSYEVIWAVQADGGSFELRVMRWDETTQTQSFMTLDSMSGAGQKTVKYALKPNDYLTIWCTSGTGVICHYVRIRVKG